MKKINDSIVWEGMSFNTLAMAMSSHQDTTFGAYVDRLARNGEWHAASALHALACSVKADLTVRQPAVEPALLGHFVRSWGVAVDRNAARRPRQRPALLGSSSAG